MVHPPERLLASPIPLRREPSKIIFHLLLSYQELHPKFDSVKTED